MLQKIMVPLLLALLATACATTTVRTAGNVGPAVVPVVAEAGALARGLATLPDAERTAAAARIDRLLATLDDATLAREAAALPAGDPLYDFAGRALLNRGLPLPRPFTRGSDWRFDAGVIVLRCAWRYCCR